MSYQPGSLRSDFLLDPSVTFLNHGSFGATPIPVFDSYQHWQRELEFEPVEFISRRGPALLRESREVLADFLHCGKDDLVYVPNATYGINVVVRSLKLGPDDEVLSTDHEYGAIEKTWRFCGEKQGYRFINHPMPPQPFDSKEEWLEMFWKGVTDKTRVIAVSHYTAPTALIFPIQELCQRAREAGIMTVIDGAHAPGQMDLNLTELGADFYSGNLHKWVCAPKGSAFLYARPERQALIEPLVVSWGYQSSNPGPSTFIDNLEWTGTRDVSAYIAAADAVKYLQQHDWPSVVATCHQLAIETLEALTQWSQQPPISTTSWFSQMVSAPLRPDLDLKGLGEFLRSRKIVVPIGEWNNRKAARVSVQAYTTRQDLAFLIDSIKEFAEIR